MAILGMILGSVAMTLGSLIAAFLLNWVFWRAGMLLRHPDWGTALLLPTIGLVLVERLVSGQFLVLTGVIAGLFSIGFWAEGRAWRRRNSSVQGPHPSPQDLPQSKKSSAALSTQAVPESSSHPRVYPALTSCIGEARRAHPAEVKIVAARMRRELFSRREQIADFGVRRKIIRTARRALEGDG